MLNRQLKKNTRKHKTALWPSCIQAVERLEDRRLLSTVTWISTSSGLWDNPANWSTGAVPGAGDDVVINVSGAAPTVTINSGESFTVNSIQSSDGLAIAGNLTVSAASQISGALSLTAGSLTGNGTITLSGNTDWTGGTIAGTVINTGMATVSAAAGGDILLGGTLENQGTILDTGTGNFGFLNGGVLQNDAGATFNLETDSGFGCYQLNSNASFDNAGRLLKSAGTGNSAFISVPGDGSNMLLNNSGTISVHSGTLTVGSGGTFTGGNFIVVPGATLDTTGGSTVNYTGTFTGSGGGDVSLNSGTLNIGAGGAIFDFPAGLFQWSGGTLTASSGTLVNTGEITVDPGSGGNTFLEGTLRNKGTVTQTGAGNFGLANTATFQNDAVGTYDLETDGGFGCYQLNSNAQFVNVGTLLKSAGTGDSSFFAVPGYGSSMVLNNSGTISVQSGTLSVADGGTFSSCNFLIAAGATFDPTGTSNVTYTGTFTGSGGGTFALATGTITIGTGGATFDFPAGFFNWTGGTINASNTLTNTNSMLIDPVSGAIVLLQGMLNNEATVIQKKAGNFGLANETTFNNDVGATYDLESDGGFGCYQLNSNASFDNAGLFDKSAGAGLSSFLAVPGYGSSMVFNSTGTIEIDTGTLSVNSSGTFTGVNFVVATGAVLDTTGGSPVTYVGTITGSGGGTISLAAGTINIGSGGATFNFPAGMFQWTGGTINASSGNLINANSITVDPALGTETLLSGMLENQATLTQDGAGNFGFLNESVLQNDPNATYDLETDGSFGCYQLNSNAQFINEGTLIKSAGTGDSSFFQVPGYGSNIALNNSGTISIQTGTLSVASGGTFTAGDFLVATGATFNPTAGPNVTYEGTFTGSGGGTMLLSEGTLTTGNGGATFNFPAGYFDWTGGTINADSTLTNVAYMTVNPTAGNNVLLSGTLDNQATIIQQKAGNFGFLNAAVLNNAVGATYDLASDGGFGCYQLNSNAQFVNAGNFIKSAGIGDSAFFGVPGDSSTVALNDTGTIEVDIGTLTVATGGTFNGANLIIATGATIDPTGGSNITYVGTITGSGGGTLALVDGTLTIGTGGATFDFPTGFFDWSGGTINASNILTNADSMLINPIAATNVFLLGTLDNQGTITQKKAGNFGFANGATINNAAGATYDLASDGGFGTYQLNSNGFFDNSGTLLKSAGSGTSAFFGVPGDGSNAQLNNSGTIEVDAGTLAVETGGTFTGGNFIVASGSVFDLTGGSTVTYTGNYTGSGGGTVLLASGAINTGGPTATFDFPAGLFQWTGGEINTAGGFTNTGSITVNPSLGNNTLLTGTLVNQGTFNQIGEGDFGFLNGATFQNDVGAVYNLESDGGFGTYQLNSNALFLNDGTLVKSAGTGDSSLHPVPGDGSTVALNNAGTVESESGTLSFAGPVAQINGDSLTGGTWDALDGSTLALPTGVTITENAGNIALNGVGASFAGSGGLTNNDGSLSLDDGATFTVPGNLANNGTLSLGSNSALTVTDTYIQGSSGTLAYLLAGTPGSQKFGELLVQQQATFAGTIDVVPVDGYSPTPGEVFTVATYPSVSGNFSAVEGPEVNGNQAFTVGVNPSDVVINAVLSIPNTITVQNGVVTGQGNSSSSAGSVSVSGGNVLVTLDGTTQAIPLNSVSMVQLSLGSGDDSVTLGAGVPPVSVKGGSGNDTVVGADGGDTLVGGSGNDSIVASSGNNVLAGGGGANTLIGGTGGDMLLGGSGKDLLVSGVGANTVLGGSSDDTIATTGGSGQLLQGGAGSNTFLNGEGTGATLQGGNGLNFAQDNAGDTMNNILETFDPTPPSAEPIPALAAENAPVAQPLDQSSVTAGVSGGILIVRGTSGDDSISITTDGVGDFLVNANGDTPISIPEVDVTNIYLSGGMGNDTLSVASDITIQARIRGNDGNDSINGGGGDNVLIGGAGSDTLVGGLGENLLVPDLRNTFAAGSSDRDVLIGGPAGSQNIADLSHRTDNLYISNDGVHHGGVTIMPNVLNIFAGTGQDTVVGTTPGEFMTAGAGQDSVVSAGANTIMVAGPTGAGEDTVVASGIANSLFLMNGHADEYQGFTTADFLQADPSDLSM